jgi:ATP-binding cassette subfamily C protein CydD
MTDADRQNGKTLSSLTRHGGPWLIVAMAAPLAGGALLVWQAWMLASVVGGAIEGGASPASLAPAIGLILILLLVRAALGALGERAGTAGAEAIKTELRGRLYSHLLARAPRSVTQPQSGAAAAAIIDQVDALDGFFAHYLPALIQPAYYPSPSAPSSCRSTGWPACCS